MKWSSQLEEKSIKGVADLVVSVVGRGRTRAQSRDNLSSVSVEQPEVWLTLTSHGRRELEAGAR